MSVLVEPPSVSSMYRTVADETVELFNFNLPAPGSESDVFVEN